MKYIMLNKYGFIIFFIVNTFILTFLAVDSVEQIVSEELVVFGQAIRPLELLPLAS
jgi:hypothetical protein